MINHKIIRILAALAVAASLIALGMFAMLALQSGMVNWAAIAGCLVVALGAASRLHKSSAARPAAPMQDHEQCTERAGV